MTKLLLGTVLTLATSVASATAVTWTTTDNNINYYFENGTEIDNNLYALFDVDNFGGAQDDALVINKPADKIKVELSGSDFNLTSIYTNQTITLLNDNEFILATSSDSGLSWSTVFSAQEIFPGSSWYELTFTTGTLTQVDADLQAVPVPAAAWLFSTGLIGMVAVARRKS